MHTFSKQRDENAITIDAPLKSIIHQRNKSTPSLTSALLQSKGLAANPIRRTAFADISNQARPVSSQDNGKVNINVKPLPQTLLESKPMNALRPAQRPLSVINQKALPAEPKSSVVSATSSYASVPISENALPRKTLIKRRTTIFRETSTVVPTRSEIIAELKSSAGISQLPNVPVVNDSVCEPSEPAQIIEPVENLVSITDQLSAPLSSVLQPESILEPTSTDVDNEPALSSLIPNPPPHQQLPDPELYLPALELQSSKPLQVSNVEAKRPSDTASLKQDADIEEYWEEEEEEYFDAEGGVTARSIRSIGGDNTTGGVSIVMNPRTNFRIERELAAAKVWVDENTTADEIDDEAWDTTMVAEYGEDIFAYMRELEVS
jgi:G2/mitotic-specific cyclin 3/4